MTCRSRVRYLLSVAGAAVLVGVVLPAAAGAPWPAIGRALASVPPPALALLAVVWAAGLLAHTVTLTAALPGLTHRRALTLSLTGSAVANVLPLGGAAGIALNYSMVSSWGFDRRAFTAYTVVSNLWDVLGKLIVPEVALVALVLAPVPGVGSFRTAAALAAAGLVVLVPSVCWAASRSQRLRTAGALVHACRGVVSSSWRRLTVGMAGYLVSLGVLLELCLAVTGVRLPLTGLLVALAVERLTTLANLTPGGLGVVELGLVGVLIAMGGSPSAVVAGVLVYRALTFGLEIPVGGLWLAGWWTTRRPWFGPARAVA